MKNYKLLFKNVIKINEFLKNKEKFNNQYRMLFKMLMQTNKIKQNMMILKKFLIKFISLIIFE